MRQTEPVRPEEKWRMDTVSAIRVKSRGRGDSGLVSCPLENCQKPVGFRVHRNGKVTFQCPTHGRGTVSEARAIKMAGDVTRIISIANPFGAYHRSLHCSGGIFAEWKKYVARRGIKGRVVVVTQPIGRASRVWRGKRVTVIAGRK